MSSADIVTSDSIIAVGTNGRDSQQSVLTAADARRAGKFLQWCRARGVCDCDRGGQLKLAHRLWCASVSEGSVRGHTDTTRKEYATTIQTVLDRFGGLPWRPTLRHARRLDEAQGIIGLRYR
jgi:hypothetical protein